MSKICYRISYDMIYCRKQFDIINYITFRCMTCHIMRHATLQFETKLLKCIWMGITIFKVFIWGGISSDICLGITFYGSARSRITIKLNIQLYIRQYTSTNENFEYGYPLWMLKPFSGFLFVCSMICSCSKHAFIANNMDPELISDCFLSDQSL